MRELIFFKKGQRKFKLSSKSELKDYFENNISDISFDTNLENITEKELKERYYNIVKNGVNTFIPNKVNNIILFLGAGASVVTDNSNYGKTMKTIAQECFKSLSETSYGNELLSDNKLGELVNYPFNGPENVDLEKLISRINLYLKLNVTDSNKADINGDVYKVLQVKDKIYEVIKSEVNYDYDSNSMNHVAVINDLNNKLSSNYKLNIVTTNYDLLVEKAASLEGYTIFDGFTFERIPVFEPDMFNWNLVKDVPNLDTKENIYRKKVINLLKIHGSIDWYKDKQGIHRSMDTAQKPLMIFPSSDKYMQSYENPYFELFTEFQSLLRRSNTLLITSGFSFSDNHIAQMIIEALKTNESLKCLITDFDIGKMDKGKYHKNSNNDNWETLMKISENSNSVAFLNATMNDKNHGLDFYLG